jgi:hypothetical protein
MEMTSTESATVYEAIRNGCRTVELVARRVDDRPDAALIMRDVDAMMGRAEFLIFDLTKERPNVYYELGYAHGMGNHAGNMLLLAQEGTRVHFDVAPLRVHFYSTLHHLESLVATKLSEMKRGTRHATSAVPLKTARRWWKWR